MDVANMNIKFYRPVAKYDFENKIGIQNLDADTLELFKLLNSGSDGYYTHLSNKMWNAYKE